VTRIRDERNFHRHVDTRHHPAAGQIDPVPFLWRLDEMNADEQKRLFAEWTEDYAARKQEDGMPSPIAADKGGGSANGQARQATGDRTSMGDEDTRMSQFMEQFEQVRPVTRNLIEAILLDMWPTHPAAIVDFGLDSQKHYEALYYPLRDGGIMPQALDDALGDGEKLTVLTRSAESNPHQDIVFSTSWDVVMGRDRQPPTPSPSEIVARHGGPTAEPASGQDRGPEWEKDKGRGR
jgi:hypothetical protein